MVKGAGEAKQSCRNEAPLFDTAFICRLSIVSETVLVRFAAVTSSSAVSGEISV